MAGELQNPPGVYPPQAHYSHVARSGNTLYISGQLAFDPSGAVVGIGDARAQARQCYDNLAAILAHYGGGFRNLLKTTTYITHWGYRSLVAAARDEVFPAPPYREHPRRRAGPRRAALSRRDRGHRGPRLTALHDIRPGDRSRSARRGP